MPLTVSVRSIKRRLDLRRRGELEVVVDEMLVHIVGHHMDMRVLRQHIGERLQFGTRIGGAGRVRRRVEDEPFRLRRDRALELPRGVILKPLACVVDDLDRLAAGEQHHVGIAHPVRRRDDDLVARIERRDEGIVQHLLAAGADR